MGKIELNRASQHPVVRLTGHIDYTDEAVANLRSLLFDVREEGNLVVIDVQDLGSACEEVLAILIGFVKRQQNTDKHLTLLSPNTHLQKRLKTMGVYEMLTPSFTLEEAFKTLKAA